LAAILAADIAGYSALMGSNEASTVRDLKEHQAVVLPMIGQFGGRVIDTAGDGILAEFGSVVNAVECAVAVQETMAKRNAAVEQRLRMQYRIGINQGDVMFDEARVYGDGINVAARLEGIAEPGGLCVSGKVHDEIRGKIELAYEDIGEQRLKNIAQPVRVYRVKLSGAKGASPRPGEENVRLAMPAKPSIAVLAFNNMGGDPEQEYFADGISEDIITALSKLSQLFVIARNSSFTFKGRNVNVQEVGRNLSVRYVLEGSVRKSGNRVRITAQLIDATSGGHLWAERFDRDLSDIFAVQDDVTQQIVGALELNLTAGDQQRLATEHTDNLEAYDCFLRGREQWWRLTKGSIIQARELFQRAIELEPTFAPPYAFLAGAHTLEYVNRWSPLPSKSLEEADRAATRAVALDDRYPYAHWQQAIINLYMRRHDLAIREAERTIALDPNLAVGYEILGTSLTYSGRPAEALACFDRAMAQDPYFPDMWLHFQAQAMFQLGQYDEAVACLKRRLVRNPDTDISRVLLAASYGHLGQINEARAAWNEALRINPSYSLEHRRKVLPYKNPDDFELVVDGLCKAGIVE